MRKILSVATFGLILSACASPKMPSLSGVYEANLPCADCSAIHSNLELDGGKFTLTDHYEGQLNSFVQNGEFSEENGIIYLKGEQTIALKRVKDGLLMLGADLSEPENKAHYTYKRK